MLEDNLYMFKAHVNRVVDGDTLVVTIDHGMQVYSERRIRLLDVDTPERGQDNHKEATNFTKSKLEDKDVIIQTYKGDSFGRYLAKVYYNEDNNYKNISEEIIKKGLVKPDSKWNKE
ncbi:nuclease [Staphylococcus phage CF5]|uniref:Nuclease n=1 Tax=Staphylococcus phage CF5 TaxID=3113739 RepID=A0AAX4J711_9CAUD|nr:nuclease [Staphylococcus phage CF5]